MSEDSHSPAPVDAWYKDAVIYELHVRAFADSNADGIGDFPGLVDRLDYLRDLGVTAIWLLPFYPSPLRDDGYDIADYENVNPSYGTLRDVRRFIREAHARGLRVITELVCNHTSDQHPWFQRARRARPGSPMRDFYVWSDTPERYREARIIFKDFEPSNWSWDPVAHAYYWHRFYSHQPDLNFENPAVKRAILKALDFWLELGVDGVRLDAVPYLHEREGTNCENLPETHSVLKEMRSHVDRNFPGRMLLAEANQWPEDAVSYFGDGDECHMAFHFPLMPRLFMSIRMEDRFPIVDILAQTPAIPESAQWALFLRNHDELTLEMVTDEERDYMYRAYTQDPEARINLGIRRRLAPLLQNNRRRIELMNALLFSLPGTPVLYYGDEIGMGDNIYLGDRNGVRTPMQWNADRNAGFSRADRQRLYLPVIVDAEYHYEAVNVENQQQNPQSLLSFMRRMITLRKRYTAFGRGSFEFLHPSNRRVLAFVRRLGDEVILVVGNLSRFVQHTELDLGAHQGSVPIEMFGRTEFPPVTERPYFLTLGPHAYYWFTLEPQAVVPGASLPAGDAGRLPELRPGGPWTDLVTGPARARLEAVLPQHLRGRRWFGGKGRQITGVRIGGAVPVSHAAGEALLTVVDVSYVDGDPEAYLVPLGMLTGDRALEILQRSPGSGVARITGADDPGLLYDCLSDPSFAERLLDVIASRRRLRSGADTVVGTCAPALAGRLSLTGAGLQASASEAEQSNNSVIFGEQLILKLYRRVEAGLNPDFEIGRFLEEDTGFDHIAPVLGAIELRRGGQDPFTLAVLQAYVPNQGDAWARARDGLEDFFQRAQERGPDAGAPDLGPSPWRGGDDHPLAAELMAGQIRRARLLGRRTAEMHHALASGTGRPAFAPEPPSMLAQRSMYQGARSLTSRVLAQLRQATPGLPEPARALAAEVLETEAVLLGRLRAVLSQTIAAHRIRVHGDYHLGQVLHTGDDFVVIDFEGEPARPLRERRMKRYAMRDVAGMIRSYDYAASSAVAGREELRGWARFWAASASAAYLDEYVRAAQGSVFLPPDAGEAAVLLDAHLIEKAVYELQYELNNRPHWVPIPLRGLLDLARAATGGD